MAEPAAKKSKVERGDIVLAVISPLKGSVIEVRVGKSGTCVHFVPGVIVSPLAKS
jgi:hypothetical protein